MDGEQSGLDAGLDEMFAGLPDVGESEANADGNLAESVAPDGQGVAPSDPESSPDPSADPTIQNATEPEIDWKAKAEENARAAEQLTEFQTKLQAAVQAKQLQAQRQQEAQQRERGHQEFLFRIASRLAEQNGGEPAEFRSQAEQIAERINEHPEVQHIQHAYQQTAQTAEAQMASVTALLMSLDAAVEDGLMTPEAAKTVQDQALALRKMPSFEAMQSQTQRDAQMKKVFRDQLKKVSAENEALKAQLESRTRVAAGVDRVATGGTPASGNGSKIDSFLDDFFG